MTKKNWLEIGLGSIQTFSRKIFLTWKILILHISDNLELLKDNFSTNFNIYCQWVISLFFAHDPFCFNTWFVDFTEFFVWGQSKPLEWRILSLTVLTAIHQFLISRNILYFSPCQTVRSQYVISSTSMSKTRFCVIFSSTCFVYTRHTRLYRPLILKDFTTTIFKDFQDTATRFIDCARTSLVLSPAFNKIVFERIWNFLVKVLPLESWFCSVLETQQ